MANFPADPIPFLPRGGGIADGGGALRKLRNVVTISGQHIRRHEDMVIAECEAPLILAERHDLLQQINTHVTQWVEDQHFNAPLPPFQADGAAHQNFDHIPEDAPEEEWAPWPVIPEEPQDIMADQPMEEISVGLSAVYDPSGNNSITVSDRAVEATLDQNSASPVIGVQNLTLANLEQQMAQLQSAIEALRLSSTDIDMPDAASCEAALRDDTVEPPIEATPKRIPPPITIVYKRRRHTLEAPGPSKDMVVSPSQKKKILTSQVGLRRSARIRNKLMGFRQGNPPDQIKLQHMQAASSRGSKGKEVLMPAMPSLQDFINATAAGMFHIPLSIDQIQHSAIHICDIDAAQVSKDKLSADLGGDSQIVPFTGNSLNGNDKDPL
ncbi:hypothetical protein GUJ93_ZPchr0001g30165 [Zizania palustris]|uniref:DUF7597 domain-containing protein n=1 Tax=Zizania palustris TaxID=103762 RepID=A0A8J5VPY4_ZIZPA|nr:hypothetical protein GUJ93_ZPchr0001g30165 [Zizania palustris]